MGILQKFAIIRAHHSSTAMCTGFCYSNGALLAGVTALPVNDHLPPAGRRRALVDPVPEQVQVHQPGSHVEFVVEPADGLAVLVCQARLSLEPSDGVFHAHPGGVDPVVVLLLCSQGAVVF